MIRYLKIVFIILLLATSTRFFEAKFINFTLESYLQIVFCLVGILISAPYIFKKHIIGFNLAILFLFFSVIFSICCAIISWDQSIVDSFKATIPFALWIFAFYLTNSNIQISTIEKIILSFGIIYVLLYIFQILNANTIYFGWKEEIEKERGVLRFVLPGGDIFVLATLIGLVKFKTQEKINWEWSPIILIGIIIPFMQATRQYIVAISFMYLIHFLYKSNIVRKIIIFLFFSIGLILLFTSQHPIIQGIIGAQNETINEGKDYIRIRSGQYFINDFSPETINRIFGNGIAYGDKSYYGKFVSNLRKEKYFDVSDIGLIGAYAMFGILFIIGYIIIWINSFKLKLPPEYRYAKYYLWYILITSITCDSVYHHNSIMANIFAISIFQIGHMKFRYDKMKYHFNSFIIQKKNPQTH